MAIDLQKLEQKFDALINDENFVTDLEQWLEARKQKQALPQADVTSNGGFTWDDFCQTKTMTKKIIIPNGILTLNESKAECPHCERKIPFDEIEDKWAKQDRHYMKMKCKCNRFIGITSDIRGDFVAYEL